LYIISQVNAYKDNKNLYTSVLIKIVIYYKLNKYNIINNHIDTSTYYNILPSVCEELYYIANSDFNRGISINYSKDKDVSINNSKDKDISADNSKDKNISTDNFKNKDINTDNSKDKNINTNNSKNKDIGADNSIKENDLD
jgi:hypothetical protein